ncbi:hypothetical protein PRIPAC_95293 [Pristionchus pacificus]|uniref:Uncharacterized protein n=1 Tax=Pristionchus pacificus TaxID=54126 RepID=A0A2A6BJ07_PRIPA|nr:hypothetical protein PRIPAC_95293 [Pristionchus pacificus]|eukprot:PDM65833.1 hypothetical protein PRIPAC_45234 [Pristionchus pacificus]
MLSRIASLFLLGTLLIVSKAKQIRVEVRGDAACSLENKAGTWVMLELFLDKSQRGVNYFDGQYGAIVLGGDYEVEEGKTVTPRVKVTHNCFTSKHEASFIITLDSVEGTKEIKLPSTIDFKDLTHYSFTRV